MKTLILAYKTPDFSGPAALISGPENGATNIAKFRHMKSANDFGDGFRSAQLWYENPKMREAWIALTNKPKIKKEKVTK